MLKSYLIDHRAFNDTDAQKIVKGLVIQMNGYDNDRYVVYDVITDCNRPSYQLINLCTHTFCHSDYIRPLSQKFGIGFYYDDENPQFIDDFEIALLLSEAEQHKQAEQAENQRKAERDEQLITIGRERLQNLMPENAKAIILAELHTDESDSMTDYFNYRIVRTVILGFSTHTKDLFSEMRKFAANFEETAYLSEENKNYEQREKYSGGSGYFLGQSKYSGWIIKKVRFYGSREQSLEHYALIAGEEENICLKTKTAKHIADTEAITGDFLIVDYSEKALAVFGDTRPIKNQLTAIGGRFNAKLTHEGVKTAGWVFSKTKEQEVRNLLTIK